MTDRELLEMAAKAAGYDTSHHWNAERMSLKPPVIGLCIPNVGNFWNPLEDSGHALNLAASLRLFMIFTGRTVRVHKAGRDCKLAIEELGLDGEAATRRAIVRAAAELVMGIKAGKEMG